MTAAPPPVALSATPARVELAGAASAAIRIANPSGGRAVVDVSPAGFALDLRGRPRILVRRDPDVRVAVRPAVVGLRPGGSASVTVRASLGPHPRPGDHAALVLLRTRPRSALAVGVRVQVGVIVVVRVPGTVVHRIAIVGVRVARRLLEVSLRNAGNVVERLGPRTVHVVFRRDGRTVRTARVGQRDLLPGARAIVAVRRPGGRVQAEVEVVDGAGTRVRRALTTG